MYCTTLQPSCTTQRPCLYVQDCAFIHPKRLLSPWRVWIFIANRSWLPCEVPKEITRRPEYQFGLSLFLPVNLVSWLVLGKKKIIFNERTRVTVKYACITLLIWVLCRVRFWFHVSNLERNGGIVNRVPSYACVFDKAFLLTTLSSSPMHVQTCVHAEEHVVHVHHVLYRNTPCCRGMVLGS